MRAMSRGSFPSATPAQAKEDLVRLVGCYNATMHHLPLILPKAQHDR